MYQPEKQTWDDDARKAHQRERFGVVVKTILEGNAFYREKWRGIPENRLAYDHLEDLPFTVKGELLADQQKHPPFGSTLSFEPSRSSRMHQPSGTPRPPPPRAVRRPGAPPTAAKGTGRARAAPSR